jgi:methionine sulfoxide reductase heme-binding subunit
MNQRQTQRLLSHHIPLALATGVSIAGLFATRPYRDWVSRLSFATAYPALFLLAITLWIGPVALIRRARNPVSSDMRRDIGIWAGATGVLHALAGQCVHLRGRPWLYYIYEKGAPHVLPLRHDLFGFANYSGLFSALILIALFATSNDLSLGRLKPSKWKSLQRWSYLCFGLAALHTFMYQASEKLQGPFVSVAVVCVLLTLAFQLSGVWAWQMNGTPAGKAPQSSLPPEPSSGRDQR